MLNTRSSGKSEGGIFFAPKDGGLLVLLASLWGASFLFMRVASAVLCPVVLIDLRVLIADLVLLLVAGVLRHRLRILHQWKAYLLLGALNAAIPFSLIAAAELSLDASWAAILNATTPLFTALVAYGWTHDPLTPRKLGGLALGIVGVAVLVGWNAHPITEHMIRAVGLSLTAALFYGIVGVFASRRFRGETPLTLAVGQQLAAGILLTPVAVFFLPHRLPGPSVIGSVLGLAVLSTSLGYLLYFRLIRQVGPVKTLGVTFLVPVFGVLWGWLFLHESVSIGTFMGLFVILFSVTMVTNIPLKFRRKREPMPD